MATTAVTSTITIRLTENLQRIDANDTAPQLLDLGRGGSSLHDEDMLVPEIEGHERFENLVQRSGTIFRFDY